MYVAIISSLFLLAAALLLRSEPIRKLPLMQPISFFFFTEAAWTLVSGILLQFWSNAARWTSFGHYILMAVAAGYVFYCGCGVYQERKKSGAHASSKEKKHEKHEKHGRNPRPED